LSHHVKNHETASETTVLASSTYLVRHITIEINGSPFERLDDLPAIEHLLTDIARALDTETFERASHQFEPQGVTSLLIVGASHLSIHTWPEYGYASVDLVICTDGFDLSAIIDLARERLQASHVSYMEFRRGLIKT
jgi:S-adenosylmethionine decarboxylase proenzyme